MRSSDTNDQINPKILRTIKFIISNIIDDVLQVSEVTPHEWRTPKLLEIQLWFTRVQSFRTRRRVWPYIVFSQKIHRLLDMDK